MNSREVMMVSAATVFGALAPALAIKFLFRHKTLSSKSNSAQNGVVSKKPLLKALLIPPNEKAERSKDPNRQVGACLVSQKDIILGIGYNGFPRGCSDDKLPWAKKSQNGDPLDTKYPYVCHAEVNAILNTNHASAAGQRLYVTMFPCNECAKIIIQSGVSEVINFVEKRLNNSDTAYAASHKLLSMAGIKVRRHRPHMNQILIKFEEP
ncbi:Cytidine and deoxycytidylate deaminase domain [Dillenia turbinata]|uniref:dCMP deaminase n=1 Tax=Dillenia turbinata TaxID=194707 RepID=A0AAN8Z6V9_9MAGN